MTRRLAAAVATFLGSAVFLLVVGRHYPVRDWLFWLFAGEWLLSAGWAVSCAAGGHLVLTRIVRIRVPLRERLLLSFATGVLVFAVGVFLAGVLGVLGGAFFVLWPLVLIAAGGRPLVQELRAVLPRAARSRLRRARSPWSVPVLAFGVLGILLLYLQILTPANVSYDSRWYHMGLAEHYAVNRGIGPFPEGWFLGTLPQLSAWLYTWALLAPGVSELFKIELAAHLEFALFLATLAGIPIVVRWLTGGRGHRASWAAVFLFPGIFLYDANLNLGADHVLAFWALPLVIAFRRLARRGGGVVLGVMLAGAALTKYQAGYLAAGIGTMFLWGRFRERLPALGVAVLVAVFLTTPHWGKNLIWYGNPVYPFLQPSLGGEPWSAGAAFDMEDPGFRPEGGVGARLAATAGALFTFSFVPNNWESLHGDVPVFGSLFTILLLPLVFLRRTRRVFGLAIAAIRRSRSVAPG